MPDTNTQEVNAQWLEEHEDYMSLRIDIPEGAFIPQDRKAALKTEVESQFKTALEYA